ncbi:hypothetical protein PIB30_108178, partial [Stylosanthes scabra]|nr:hypothetical protein [Stylosanthes scabra]
MIFNLYVTTWRKHQCRRDTNDTKNGPMPLPLKCVIGSEQVPHPCMRDYTCSPKLPVPHPIPAALEQPCHVTQPHGTRKKTHK